MNEKCQSCKHHSHDDNRAHRDQCAKFGSAPVWLAFQEGHYCKQGQHHEPKAKG